MLLDRDAQIQELKMLVNQGQDQSDFLGTIQDLEDKVQALEAELRAREEADDDEEPVFVKSESRKVQRSAAPPPARNVDANRVNQLEAELQQAKINLNDQQAEFEKLLAKQAEEMTMEFERSLKKQATVMAEEEMKQAVLGRPDLNLEEISQLKAELEEKSTTCDSLKRLIAQQDEVVSEQKKVLEAQTSSATFAVENMQKMLKEAQQRLKDDIVRMQSKDAEIATLRESVTAMAEAEQHAKQALQDKARMDKQMFDVQSNLDRRIKENQGLVLQVEELKKQIHAQAIEIEKQVNNQKQASQAEIKRVRDDCRREYDALKAKNQQLINTGESNMKHTWELQDQTQRLMRELEDRTHSLDMKEKTAAKLTADLREKQKTLSSMQTKMDRMENAIMTQETLLLEANREGDHLREKISSLERAAQESIHETELGAFEELAMVKNRLHVLEGEYEAMKGMVENKEPDGEGSAIKVRKQGRIAQRSAPPPPPPSGMASVRADQEHMMASSDVRLAQLEMEVSREKDRADAAEHAATQLKVDLLMYEEKYEDDWQDQLAARKHELLMEIQTTAESSRRAEEQINALQVELDEERHKHNERQSQANDEKIEMQAKMEILQSREQSPAREESDRRDQKILLLQLEEANGRCTDMQTRLDNLFEKNMAAENKAREAELERKRAVDGQEKYKEEVSNLQKEMAEEQEKVLQYESLVERLQRGKRDMEGEILVLTTDAKSRVQENKHLKDQSATLSEFLEQDKATIKGLQTDLDALREAKSVAEKQMQDMFAKVTKLEEMLREAQSQREALQVEKSKRDAELRQAKDECASVSHDREVLQQKTNLLNAEVAKAQVEESKLRAEIKKSGDEIVQLKQARGSQAKEMQSLAVDLQSHSNQIQEKERQIQTLKDSVEKLTADLSNESAKGQKLAGTCEGLNEEVKGQHLQVKALEKELQLSTEQASQNMETLAKSTQHVASLEEELKKALKKVNQLTAELTHVNTQLDVLVAEKEAQNDQIRTFERRFEEASGKQNENAVLERKIIGMKSEMEVMVASKRALEDKIVHFEKQEKAWKTAEDNLNAKIRQQEASLDKLNAELQKSARAGQLSQQNCDELKSKYEELKSKEAEAAKMHKTEMGKVQEQLNQQQARHDASVAAAQEAAILRDQESSKLETELAAVKRELTDSKSRLEDEAKMLEAKLKQSVDATSSAQVQLKEMASLKDSLKTSEAEISKLSSEKVSLCEQIAQLEDLLEAKKADFAVHDERLIAAETEIQSLTKEKMSKLVESAKLLADLHASKSDSNNLTMRLHSSSERLRDTQMQADNLETEKTELLLKIERLQIENDSLTEKFNASQSEVNRLSTGGTDVMSENVALSNELQIYKTETEKLTRIVKSGEASEMLMQKMKQSWQDEKVSLESEARNMQAELALLSSRLEAAQAAERELLQQQSKLTSEVDALKGENKKLQAKADASKSKLDEQASAKQSLSGSASSDAEELKQAQEQIQDLLSQREIMIEELMQRKMLLDAAMKEAEDTMSGAEKTVKMKTDENARLVSAQPRRRLVRGEIFVPSSDCAVLRHLICPCS